MQNNMLRKIGSTRRLENVSLVLISCYYLKYYTNRNKLTYKFHIQMIT